MHKDDNKRRCHDGCEEDDNGYATLGMRKTGSTTTRQHRKNDTELQ